MRVLCLLGWHRWWFYLRGRGLAVCERCGKTIDPASAEADA
jgi:hypothetical protein